jgi:hypothetical protein
MQNYQNREVKCARIRILVAGLIGLCLLVSCVASAAPPSANQNPPNDASPKVEPITPPTLLVKLEHQQKPEQASDEWPAWRDALLRWFFGWPGLILLMASFLLFAPQALPRIQELASIFQSIKIGGAEFILSRSEGQRLSLQIKRSRKLVTQQFDEWAGMKEIVKLHHEIVEETILGSVPDLNERIRLHSLIRSTIYVPDLLFSETLYQLTDYYPPAKGERGRAFSTRFGIIGRAWRLEQSHYDKSVPTDKEKLISDWGMTLKEAKDAGHGRMSFACFVLKGISDPELVIGMIYLDAKEKEVFGDTDEGADSRWAKLEQGVQSAARDKGLSKLLEDLNDGLIEEGAHVRIYFG